MGAMGNIAHIEKVVDGDGDGFVYDGTPKMRPARPSEMKGAGKGKKLRNVARKRKNAKSRSGALRRGRRPKSSSEPGSSSKNPIHTEDADEALDLMAQGKHVEMSRKTLATSLTKLGQMAKEAEAKGDDAPDINMCLAQVKGTNIFCAHNKGIPRIKMPQLKGKNIRKGSKASKKKANDDGEVDATAEFVASLTKRGVSINDTEVPAAHLKATQTELVGAKVAGMMQAGRNPDIGFDPSKGAIFISRDGYVLDGHHRWAATVGMDLTDDDPEGDNIMMPVRIIDMAIQDLVWETADFTESFGIEGNAASPVNKELPCIGCGGAELIAKRRRKARPGPSPKSTPKEIVGSHGHKTHGKSILWPALYEHLIAKGHTKRKAAMISNGQWRRKHGLPPKSVPGTKGKIRVAKSARVPIPVNELVAMKARISPSLSRTISHVASVVSKEQMVDVAAKRRVAGVADTHAVRNRAIEMLPRSSVGSDSGTAVPYDSVSGSTLRSRPDETVTDRRASLRDLLVRRGTTHLRDASSKGGSLGSGSGSAHGTMIARSTLGRKKHGLPPKSVPGSKGKIPMSKMHPDGKDVHVDKPLGAMLPAMNKKRCKVCGKVKGKKHKCR